jgi:hypothetical protein
MPELRMLKALFTYTLLDIIKFAYRSIAEVASTLGE